MKQTIILWIMLLSLSVAGVCGVHATPDSLAILDWSVVAPGYQCYKHGNIGNAVWSLPDQDKEAHLYCAYCIIEVLDKHIGQVERVK